MEGSELAKRLLGGDRRALARAITLVQDDDPAGRELVRAVYPHTGNAAIVGFTGPPGAGKSTLIGALTRRRRVHGTRIAVLSIDPSSPFTGGAVLGDRIRLVEHFLDDGVFIRSMATRGALGGVAEAALQTALLMDASGREEIYIETVGVGQAEVDIVDHADTVVLVLVPGSGDSVQALKAGVMEIPDIIVVNKADHPLTGTLVRERAHTPASDEAQGRPGVVDRAHLVVHEARGQAGVADGAVIEIGANPGAALGPGDPQAAARLERHDERVETAFEQRARAGELDDDAERAAQARADLRLGELIRKPGRGAHRRDAGTGGDPELAGQRRAWCIARFHVLVERRSGATSGRRRASGARAA